MAEKITYIYDKDDEVVLKVKYEENSHGTLCGYDGCPLARAYPDKEEEFCGLCEDTTRLDSGEQFWPDSDHGPAWCTKNEIISCDLIKTPEDEKLKFNLVDLKENICKHYCFLEKDPSECNPREMCKYNTCMLSELIKKEIKREDN